LKKWELKKSGKDIIQYGAILYFRWRMIAWVQGPVTKPKRQQKDALSERRVKSVTTEQAKKLLKSVIDSVTSESVKHQ